jgi:alpha-1,6-mannosyltransferase
LALVGRLIIMPELATFLYLAVGAAVLAGFGLTALLRRPADAPGLDVSMLLLVAFTIIISPHHPWYFTWAIPFLCIRPSAAVMFLSGAAPLLYGKVWAPGDDVLNAALYGPFALILIIETLVGRAGAPAKEYRHGRQPAA